MLTEAHVCVTCCMHLHCFRSFPPPPRQIDNALFRAVCGVGTRGRELSLMASRCAEATELF